MIPNTRPMWLLMHVLSWNIIDELDNDNVKRHLAYTMDYNHYTQGGNCLLFLKQTKEKKPNAQALRLYHQFLI